MHYELKRALRPVKRRIRRNRFLQGAAAGLAAGLAAAAVLQAASFFAPVPDRRLWAAAAAAAVALAAALGNAARPVKNVTAAEAADSCGLQERAVTAVEGCEGPIGELQRRDACTALKKLDVKKIRPAGMKKALTAALGCAVLLCALAAIPSPKDSEAASRRALERTLSEAREMVQQAAEEDEKGLPEEKKSELRRITADLDRELRDSRDAADALVALDRAEQRLEQLRQRTAGEAAEAANGMAGDNGSGTEGNTGTASGQASGDGTQPGNGQAAEAGAGSTADGQLKTLETLAALKGMVNPSLQAGQGARTADGQPGTQAGQGAEGMSGSSGRNGQNGMNGSGMSGSGNGRAGGGAGEGSTNEEAQGSGNKGGQPVPGSRDPRYKEGQYETIYDPERISKSSQDVMTEQNRLGDEGSVQTEIGPGRGSTDGNVPWSEALQDYAETEARAADRENLTVQERRWVDEYYRLLTEQK